LKCSWVRCDLAGTGHVQFSTWRWRSGRDLRALVNQVLGAVKRTSSPKDFMLTEKDFVLI
jgi:hypothetical protein